MTRKLRFGLVSDSHYAEKEMVNNKYYRQSLRKMIEFVEVMNKEEVDFVMHLGDFKDEDAMKEEKHTLQCLIELESVYGGFYGARYHCVGNHDVDSITKQQFLSNIVNTDIPKDQSYYSFDREGFHVVVLDASYDAEGNDHFFKEKGHFEDAFIPDPEIAWLATDLKKTQLPVIVFSHYLLFEFRKWGYRFHAGRHEQVRELLEKSNKVLAVFHGHAHTELHQEINGIHYVVMGAMVDGEGEENNQYALVEINDKEIEITGYRKASSRKYSHVFRA